MRSLLIITGILISMVSFAQPVEARRHDFQVKKGVEQLTAVLKLSQEQAAAWQKMEDSCVRIMKTVKTTKPGVEARGNEMGTLLAARETAIKQLLTQEQYDKYVQMKEAARKNAEEQRKKFMAERRSKS